MTASARFGDTAPTPGVYDVRPAFGRVTDFPEELPQFQALMRRLQPRVHAIVDVCALDLDPNGAPDYDRALQRRGPATPVHVEITHTPLFASVKGTVEEVFHWHVQRLLLDAPLGKVVHCRECETIFYRVKQQVHCSRACTNRVSQRRFRERRDATTLAATTAGS